MASRGERASSRGRGQSQSHSSRNNRLPSVNSPPDSVDDLISNPSRSPDYINPLDYKDQVLGFFNGSPLLTRQELDICFLNVFGSDPALLHWDDFHEHSALLTQQVQATKLQKRMDAANKLDQFLPGIDSIIKQRDGQQLCEWLVVDPPFSETYQAMILQLQSIEVDDDDDDDDMFESKCRAALEEVDSQQWGAFIPFIVQYLLFLRDIDVDNLLEAYDLLSELLQKCNVAFAHPSCGHLLLPTVISYSQMLAGFAIRLDKEPTLIAHVPRVSDEGPSETLPERAANVIRHALVTCLNDRTDPTNTSIAGRKAGVCKLANTCLKVLFSIQRTGNSEQIFTNVYNQAPPLALYPRAERVTYLYYLGRFLWTTNHWYRAQLALEAAYMDCHMQFLKQRRIILVYLTASNIILGRFPSAALYQRPEARGLMEKFHPICRSIAKGDLETFTRLTSMDSPNADWFVRYRILLQIRNRCEVLVWRSLARKTFLLCGRIPENPKKAPSLHLRDFQSLFLFLEARSQTPLSELRTTIPGKSHTNWMFMENSPPKIPGWTCKDFEGFEEYFETPPEDLYYSGFEDEPMLETENMFASLIGQGLLNGYISHRLHKFAVTGAKRKGALAAGFPNVWQTLTAKTNKEVPGWKKESNNKGLGGGGGQVIHLKNARPVGAGP